MPAFEDLPPETRDEVYAFAARGQRHPDPDVAQAAWQWARYEGSWLSLAAEVLVTAKFRPSPYSRSFPIFRRARAIKRLGRPPG